MEGTIDNWKALQIRNELEHLIFSSESDYACLNVGLSAEVLEPSDAGAIHPEKTMIKVNGKLPTKAKSHVAGTEIEVRAVAVDKFGNVWTK